MRVFLFLVSILWVAMGATLVLYTNQARDAMKGIVLGTSPRLWAFPPLVLGVVLLVGAFMVCEVFWLALVLGLLATAKGAYLALGPLPQISSLFTWWFDRAGEKTVRLWGLIVFTFGVTLISWLL